MAKPNSMVPSQKIKHCFFVLLLSLQTVHLHAQNDSDASAQRFNDAMKTTVHDFRQKSKGDTTLAVIERLAKYDTLLKGDMYDYYKFGLAHRKRAFEWNLVSSMVTFWVVIMLVFTGIIFAGIQFYIALKENSRRKPIPSDEIQTGTTAAPAPVVNYNALATELEASAKGIKVSSPVLGVIILVISLLFFYLYLAYVYPIQENF